ncbi:hypothetical protein IGB42_02232 [Andreprevotia sp. IGB-42]|uniref:CbtA family protein n=1 Tax=Andreprevotia sp. IGB-42 TaxID=2497473 RepID=UPI001357A60C|nr:CbtA family protein [Andreprevotia sp. IGB-42]KAF0813303.1 hypothetical protein IGB42_02232 [Andreprevotia sp. IGB-42]
MVGKLLVRGMIAGVVAGLLTFGFARVVGEPQVDHAIAFEEQASKAREAHEHVDQAQGGHVHEAEEAELVSRETQAGFGLLTSVVVYGAAFGGLFALAFAFIYGRTSKLPARPLAAWLALAAFMALVVVPSIKYPATPPAVGDPETIGYRTALFFLMIAISLVTMVFALKMRKVMMRQLGQWNASIAAGLLFVVIIAAVQLALPSFDNVPDGFPAALLWKFRVAAMGMQVIMWTTLGLLFGVLAENKLRDLHSQPVAR